MKVTRERAAENREKLLRTAGRLFRERGVDGVGVAEISREAGLTHGALYAQFGSKDALVAEALADGLRRGQERLQEDARRTPASLEGYLAYYLSPGRRDDFGGSCPMAASASEIGRQDAVVGAHFAAGFEQMVEAVQGVLQETGQPSSARERAIAMSAAMIGGLAIARGTAKSHPDFSDEILAAVARVVAEVGGSAKQPPAHRKARQTRRSSSGRSAK